MPTEPETITPAPPVEADAADPPAMLDARDCARLYHARTIRLRELAAVAASTPNPGLHHIGDSHAYDRSELDADLASAQVLALTACWHAIRAIADETTRGEMPG